jgi:enamine deaminase RidA (YjgF/YER057c/UK114 family)
MNQIASHPVPQGAYRAATRHGDLIFSSGMTPRRGGVLIHVGRMRAADPIDTHRDAVVLATLNALTAVRACLAEGERIAVVLQLTIFLNSEPEFSAHSKVADFASTALIAELGPFCIGSRASVGVASLPAQAPVEITIVASVVR